MLRRVSLFLGMGLVLISSLSFSHAAGKSISTVGTAAASGETGDRGRLSSVEMVLAAGAIPVQSATAGDSSSRNRLEARATTSRPIPIVKASASREATSSWQAGYEGTVPGSAGNHLFKAWPLPPMPFDRTVNCAVRTARPTRGPSLLEQRQMEVLLMPGDYLKSVGNLPAAASGFRYLEIEVSHHAHTLKLIGHPYLGEKSVLHECRVGLGAPSFPTPEGVYFVTHIYDDNPWWIPPPNRAWAAGQSRSKTVYGGIMAPLLKKRAVRSKKRTSDTEDRIEGPVKLDDYGYRFHGTNAPRSIGHNQSHGCVRMLPKDAKKVASLIKDHVGWSDRRESENGSFVILKSPVRLNLIK